MVLSLYSIAYAASRFALMLLPDRFGRRSFLIVPGIAGGSVLLIGLQLRSPLLVALSYPLAALCWSTEAPSLLGEVYRAFPKAMGTYQTLTHEAGYLTASIMHPVIGYIVEAVVPLRVVLSFSSPLFIAFGVIAWTRFRVDRDMAPESPERRQ